MNDTYSNLYPKDHLLKIRLSNHNNDGFFKGKMLLSMPSLKNAKKKVDEVVLVCVHDIEGIVGITINKAFPNFYLHDLERHLDFPPVSHSFRHQKIHCGGPDNIQKGLIIHSSDYQTPLTQVINESIHLSSNIGILDDIHHQRGPSNFIVCLGYHQWSQQHLEKEILDNRWTLCEAHGHLIFDHPTPQIWEKSLEHIGLNSQHFIHECGHA
jgi:putative transcriptional regulator